MLIAEFSYKGEEIEIGNELWQHDYGQKIQIKGLDLPEGGAGRSLPRGCRTVAAGD